jgi:hypothetical protein
MTGVRLSAAEVFFLFPAASRPSIRAGSCSIFLQSNAKRLKSYYVYDCMDFHLHIPTHLYEIALKRRANFIISLTVTKPVQLRSP